MKLSKKGQYALRALLALTSVYQDKANPSLHLKEIARAEDISIKFLEHIMSALKHGGMVKSQKGKGGGYTLAHPPRQITLGEVIRLIDGPLSPIGSVQEIEDAIKKKDGNSGIFSVLLDVRNAISEILDHLTLQDLYERTLELTKKSQFEMYYI